MSAIRYPYRGKRAFDLAALVVSSPLTLPIGLATALAIRLTDGAPVLFRQERAGLGGRSFHVFKFRTMSDAQGSNGDLLPDRDRLTAVGRVLRRTSLDEIPQLINVLRGEMSIVGPRPLYMRYVPHYTERERKRLAALPGITGLAQVSGRNSAGWRDRLNFDAQYVEQNSLLRDISICFQTLVKTLRSDGVSIVAGESGDPLDVERNFPSKNKLYLRRLYRRDLPLRVQWMIDPRIRQHMTVPDGITLDSTLEWFEKIENDSSRHEFSIENESGEVVAMTGLRGETARASAEFYVFVDPNAHGMGIGRVATELTVQQARRVRAIRTVTLTVSRENDKAIKIYQGLGFHVSRANEERLWMEYPVEAENA